MECPSWMFSKALSHRQKVMRLYKRCLREIHAWYFSYDTHGFLEFRFQMVLMRARFDANKDVKDMQMAQFLLADGCRQVWANRHPDPFRFPNDVGGANYDREHWTPDEIAESNFHYTWPEREQFPYYYNKREQRKKELMEHWHKIEESWDQELDSIQKKLPEEEEEGKQQPKALPTMY
uniref:NADH dehydrogenase [ubiquinone] 1 beta subcomplex subunit 9 n=1 Tax=Meloidogyne enterolobii TaxID=390850 RepID=A0A6V7UBU7_MELEN|nr:unnamed protein product [Meloidogyne enterolobii]